MVLAWENLQRFLLCWSLFCCCYSSFVNVFHLHFLFDIIPHPSVDYRQVFRPILYFQPSPSQSDSRHFHFSTIPLSSYRECYGFEWAFFTLSSFPTFLAQPAFIKASLGASSYSLKFPGLHTDSRNTDPAHLFVWFTVIHNLLYILNLYLYMSILQKFYLWWKLW